MVFAHLVVGVEHFPDGLVPDSPFVHTLLLEPDVLQAQFLEQVHIGYIALVQSGDLVLGAAADEEAALLFLGHVCG